MRRRPLALLVCVAALVGLAPQDEESAWRARAAAALAQTRGELEVAGLDRPVEVVRDRWGVPHIYAKTVHDLFFAQGFVAAQDRLWQLDLWRRQAVGALAEIVGPTAVNRDILARLLRYRGNADAEWRAYRPDAHTIADAFVAGVNAQVDVATASPERLPIEFQLTASRPGRWTADVVIGRMAGYLMTRNARSEVQRARLIASVGPARAADLMPLDPPVRVEVPEGLDLADVTDDILTLTEGVNEAVAFPGQIPGILEDPADVGSNDWVLSGRHTATGKPLLANDPHRALLLPSLRYTVHLNGPGWNVIGAGEPGLPGVAAGHNDRIAFGFTIVNMDQQDLYVERLDPDDPERYLYCGHYEPMRVEHEWVAVRGQAPRDVALRFTRHGAVLHVDARRHRAYALRWVGSEPGAAGYLKSLAVDTASTWSEFRQAVAGWKVPSENLVYADVDGNIGWIAAGLSPVRPNWSGLLPVPGHEGKYEWSGFLGIDDLPQAFNPASGFIATANHNILPAGYPHALGFEFSSPFRFGRILEVLTAGLSARHAFTVDDFERLQHDEQSVLAKAVVAAVRRVGVPAGGASDRAARMIAAWDGTVSRDSAAAALYEAWLPRLAGAVAENLAHGPGAPFGAGGAERVSNDRLFALLLQTGLSPSPSWLDAWVDGTPRPHGASLFTALDATLRERVREAVSASLAGPTLAAAWQEMTERLGPDPALWAWGRMHRASFEHALAGSPALASVLNTADVPRGGDATTPNATGTGGRQTAGASYREVIDLAHWDRSMTINVPGLSGQPGSPHYADLLPLWAEGGYHPMPFTRAAVEQCAADRLWLVPPHSGPR